MNRVRFIIVYLGPLPPWMPAYLVSCRHNPGYDWLILTDQPAPDAYPENVVFEYIDEEDFCRRCSDLLGLRYPKGAHPLKLTDFHPAYGVVFSDYLHGYEFWGHCDLDLIWGDISRFVSATVMDRNDIITSRRFKITGHFTMFRNSPGINELYRQIPGFNAYCEQGRCTRMDETIISRFLNLKYNRRRHRLLRAMTLGMVQYGPRFHWDRCLAPTGAEQTEGAIEKGLSMKWVNGRTFDFHDGETMYLHFHKLKQYMTKFDVQYLNEPGQFLINQHGITACGKPADLASV